MIKRNNGYSVIFNIVKILYLRYNFIMERSDKMNYKRLIIILAVTGVVAIILGSTFAYWRWQSTNAQKTNVTFTTGANFSCSADGGGNITSTNYFAPTDCTNSTYAIQRTITTNITNNSNNPVYMDMWLNVDELDYFLGRSYDFKYALTTNSSSCTEDVITEGSFSDAYAGNQTFNDVPLLSGVSAPGTYYLYIWLDSESTDSNLMDATAHFSIGGECTNNGPGYIYTSNMRPTSDSIYINGLMPDNVMQYQTSDAAREALKLAGDGTTYYQFYFRHALNPSKWCHGVYGFGNCYDSEAECNDDASYFDETCGNPIDNSYLGFVITPTMAQANSGMTAGTYYLRGTVSETDLSGYYPDSPYYTSNKAILDSAFGSSHCFDTGTFYNCSVTGLSVRVHADGTITASTGNDEARCDVHCDFSPEGASDCTKVTW